MNRRAFLATLAAGAAGSPSRLLAGTAPAAPAASTVHTVRGPIDAAQMGVTLVHEHVLVDFVGADKVARSRYDAEEAFRTVLPHLQELRQRGAATLLECTPAYLGRDPLLLRRLSEASGLHIVTNTGYYGAGQDRFLPPHAFTDTARQLAARWTAESRGGIEGTGIRPGFVKTGIDSGPLSAVDRKLVEAAALCHLDTGLTFAIHTSDDPPALEILDVLSRLGVPPSAWVWVHASREAKLSTRDWVARQGAWVELDKLAPETLEDHVAGVLDLAGRGLLDRVLVSQDAGWYHVGEPRGGAFSPYTFLFDAFVPALRARGLGDAEVRTLLVENPARAFAQRDGRPTTTRPTSGGSER